MDTSTVNIRNIRTKDLNDILAFTDRWIGTNYFSKEELRQFLLQGIKDNLNASLLASIDEKIIGIRISLAPGEWCDEYTPALSQNLWKVELNTVAYFKSLFIDEKYQGKGLGKILSNKSIEVLKKMGAKAIVCHSWVESPNNSSQKYLEKMGFKTINVHKNFWFFNDYDCTRCGENKQCTCSAAEMIKYL